mmetsp:Transcript_8191/g.37214  ORF Transcript_8191/g.37214 Transcript_8191/m.37214 type:complete len:207 (-) Transcript_8191:13717-14337(-)
MRTRGFLRAMEHLLADSQRLVPVHALLLPGGGQTSAGDVQLGFFPLRQRVAQLGLCLRRPVPTRARVRVGLERSRPVRRWMARVRVHRRGDIAQLQPLPATAGVLAVHVCVETRARRFLAGVEAGGAHQGADARVSQARLTARGHLGVRRGGRTGDDAVGEQARHRRRRGDDGCVHRYRGVGRRHQRYVFHGHSRQGRVSPGPGRR